LAKTKISKKMVLRPRPVLRTTSLSKAKQFGMYYWPNKLRTE